MSTRARIVILEPKTGRKNFLYRGADGYLEGLGADLVKACEEISDAPDMDSFAFKLLKGEWGLEMDIFGEDGCLDWVYTIEWGNPIGAIFAQQVRFSSGKNVLGEPVDVRAYVADLPKSDGGGFHGLTSEGRQV